MRSERLSVVLAPLFDAVEAQTLLDDRIDLQRGFNGQIQLTGYKLTILYHMRGGNKYEREVGEVQFVAEVAVVIDLRKDHRVADEEDFSETAVLPQQLYHNIKYFVG